MRLEVSKLIDRVVHQPGGLETVLDNPLVKSAQAKQMQVIATFMARHTLEEIQALAISGELEKILPAFELPIDCSAPLAEEVKLLDHRQFDDEAYAQYIESLAD